MNLKRKMEVLILAAAVRGYLLANAVQRLLHVQYSQRAVIYAALGTGIYYDESLMYDKLREFRRAMLFLDDGSLSLILDEARLIHEFKDALRHTQQTAGNDTVDEYQLAPFDELDDERLVQRVLVFIKEAGLTGL